MKNYNDDNNNNANYDHKIGFPGQFDRFVIPFDNGVFQNLKINLCHEIRHSNLYFGHSTSHFRQEIKRLPVYVIQIIIPVESIQIRHRAGQRLFKHSNS